MNKIFGFGLAMAIVALTMLAGCGEKSSTSAPHTMPDGTTMNKSMK